VYLMGLTVNKKIDQRFTKIVKCPKCTTGHICDVPRKWRIIEAKIININSPHLFLKCAACRSYVTVQWEINKKDAEINVR